MPEKLLKVVILKLTECLSHLAEDSTSRIGRNFTVYIDKRPITITLAVENQEVNK